MNVTVSSSFKKKTTKAIAAIFLFVVVYLLLVTLAIALMAACLMGGLFLIKEHPSLITLVLGGGMAIFGIMIVYFLIKFLFQTHKVDRSNLTPITRAQEPELFSFIDGIVKEVGTPFPSKIYISPEVNASVFYDSSFWSMFFPIKKSLHIGMGLVNTITQDEFKAILAHEFGHFSQKSMKVGSYVYNVNQVIYNMLYENDSYSKLITSLSNKNSYISFFMALAVKIVEGIQWILRKLYDVVNISYMELSREMEFHADAVAAHVTGYLPLKESLLRMDLANKSFTTVMGFYDGKVTEAIISDNMFEEQRFVMRFLAKEDNIPMQNGLPVVTAENNRFNHSRLNIENQWASHPEVSERIAALERLNIVKEHQNKAIATSLFSDGTQTQQFLTSTVFSHVPYEKETTAYSIADFEREFVSYYNSLTFDKRYNGYYDDKNPIPFSLSEVSTIELKETDLFAQHYVDKVYEYLALQKDGFVLDGISNKLYDVSTFDYEGQKYSAKDALKVKDRNDILLKQLETEIAAHDKCIYAYFFKKAEVLGKAYDFRGYYERFFDYDKQYDVRFELYNDLMESLRFTAEALPYNVITNKFIKVTELEVKLKEALKTIVGDPLFMFELSEEMRKDLEKYLSRDWICFDKDTYLEENLNQLMKSINDFQYLNHRGYFLVKRNLLNFQAELI